MTDASAALRQTSTAPLATTDIAIIGAGPAGAVAACRLRDAGWQVSVIEASHFPRFSIGESLLPQCLVDLDQAGLGETVRAGDYQYKNGARFRCGEEERDILFPDNAWDEAPPRPGDAFQVERADFDTRLIEAAQARGAQVRFGIRVTGFTADDQRPELTLDDGSRLQARLVLDASGFARVLTRQLGTARPPRLAERRALFTHVALPEHVPGLERQRILIGMHPSTPALWYWLIPLRDGKASLGFVGTPERLASFGPDDDSRLNALIDHFPELRTLLGQPAQLRPTGSLGGYSSDAVRLSGPGYVLLGNAGEFLDPIFSSGVTVAIRSAMLAAPLVDRQLSGEPVDWDDAYERPLRKGLETFRAFVDAWYDGRLPTIIFHPDPPGYLRRMICAVLAGYAWDERNPFVQAPGRRLDTLAQLCG
ncbi:NAD(P)/FAD-dependent oxidoreductase [Kushneria phosphatilytica]|uniref:NAD(P)/FAD-dependent oxidoreductase n=1 Tax=Kushneria phosphatilytica TaxID=657387 RepID=A0A1S1NVE6_9GAMM|nr:NAD(P)/FAD-dependent oxidoreductase [Kushneria phosphatilytica]OHV10548.1 FAD-dependent oxidoreductase [Kushneria phosphatilytica]QEL11880.1 NAD(P)/FAD-dependent oxidoreductase [Kushneria phosphatilytica]